MKYPQLVSMPSAVSDWLEEQLEARGIDAVVYTRYILSLLHSDTVDVIYSDEDLHFSHLKKEVRSGRSRKRCRRSSDWWKHAQADAEKIKRSVAVECLMSASEQSCGIESLIDELCEKLNEIKSDVKDTAVDPPAPKKVNPELIQQVSPQELAKRYYAAFPPLNRNSNSPSKLITLIPKWIPSPKRKPNHRKNKDNMKANRTVSKQRYGTYFTGRKQKEAKSSENKKARTENIVPKTESNLDWSINDDSNLYDDLPVDIKELLDDSPSSHDVTVEMMNLANMRDTGRRGFIQCGTNITSSIWTNESAMDEAKFASDSLLDFQFSAITINNNWMDSEFSYDKRSIWTLSRWSEDSGGFENDNLSLSLVKLNHKKDSSAFVEVNQRSTFNPFSKIIGPAFYRADPKTVDLDRSDKDDLLTSGRSHFRPINEKLDHAGEYADGATFAVSNSWDKINYKRTESGAMYIENDHSATRKKYHEYKKSEKDVGLVLKYLVCQNDKSCQTEDADAEVEAINCDKLAGQDEEEIEAIGDCRLHSGRAEAESAIVPDGVWAQQACDKCNNNSTFWNVHFGGMKNEGLGWQFGNVSKIWSGGEVCHDCLGRPPSTLQHSKLREDVSQDGDQLLSDISTIQKSYQEQALPVTEFSCDITDFFSKEHHQQRKRRHSIIATQLDGSWSFASRLEEDCLIQMSTIPTLRSVTL